MDFFKREIRVRWGKNPNPKPNKIKTRTGESESKWKSESESELVIVVKVETTHSAELQSFPIILGSWYFLISNTF